MFALKLLPPLSHADLEATLEKVKARLMPTNPVAVYLVGSYATGNAHGASDLDFVLVYQDQQAIRAARKYIHHGWKSALAGLPIDFIYLTSDGFTKKSAVGGMAFEAKEFGKPLFPGPWGKNDK